VLHRKNGDKITFEIKDLERGRLAVKIDYMIGTDFVDWDEVERIESDQDFQVLWRDGEISTGTLSQQIDEQLAKPDELERTFTVENDQAIEERDPEEAVSVEQLGENFLEPLDIKLDFGFTFLKDNDRRQTKIHAEVARLSRKRWFQADLNTFLSRRSDAADSSRSDAKFSYLHFFKHSWFAGSSIDFLQSDQQQLDLRTTAAGLAGRLLVSRPEVTVAAVGGAVLNQERYLTQESGSTNWELVGGARVNWYQFDSPEINAQALVYPSMSDGVTCPLHEQIPLAEIVFYLRRRNILGRHIPFSQRIR
jgi:hypothetical protein